MTIEGLDKLKDELAKKKRKLEEIERKSKAGKLTKAEYDRLVRELSD